MATGMVVVSAMWWAYFDVNALIAERALAAADGVAQIRLLAHVWFKRFLTGSLDIERLVVGIALVAVSPLVALLPAMASLAILAAALVIWETYRFAEQRHTIRHADNH